MSTDPLTATTPWETPYAFAGNGPVANIDYLGLSRVPAQGSGAPPAAGGGGNFWQGLGSALGSIGKALLGIDEGSSGGGGRRAPKPVQSYEMEQAVDLAKDNSFNFDQQLNTDPPKNGIITIFDFSSSKATTINNAINLSKKSMITGNNLNYLANRCTGPGQLDMVIHNISIRKSCTERVSVEAIQKNGTAGGADVVNYNNRSLLFDWQISLDPQTGLSYAVVNEEIIHIGQKKFYFVDNGNKEKVNSLTMETEAKALDMLSYAAVINLNSPIITPAQVYANFVSAGFQDYELSFLFNKSGRNITWATNGSMSMKTVLQNPTSIYVNTQMKELFIQQANILGKEVEKVYSKSSGWPKGQALQPFSYMKKIISK